MAIYCCGLDIQSNDLILDPTCGTGGFLVAVYDKVHKNTDDRTFKNFKKYGLYGIEEQDMIVALAIVNMIFRGDGKTNITEGNCFDIIFNCDYFYISMRSMTQYYFVICPS